MYTQSELALSRWLSEAGQSDGTAQDQEWERPIDWDSEWLLIVLKAEGKPSSLTAGMIVVGAGPCDQLVIKVPQGMAGCPMVFY